MIKVPKCTEIKSKLIEVEKAFEKFENSYSNLSAKETETDYDLFDEVNECWGDCMSLLMMEFEDESEVKRRIEIYDYLHKHWNEMTLREYEEDIESIRNKNVELVV